MKKISYVQALSERERLVKKIHDTIFRGSFLDISDQGGDKAWNSCKDRNVFCGQAKETYERYCRLRDQFYSLDQKIMETVGRGTVSVAGKNMTVLAAEVLQQNLRGCGIYDEDGDFPGMFCKKLREEYENCIREIREQNAVSIRSRELEIVDPLQMAELIERTEEEKQNLLIELETVLQTWRAMTMIETEE